MTDFLAASLGDTLSRHPVPAGAAIAVLVVGAIIVGLLRKLLLLALLCGAAAGAYLAYRAGAFPAA